MATGSPGPDAERAFDIGLAATAAGALAVIGILAFGGRISAVDAALAVTLGIPTLVIVVSCLLGVWLGYDEASLTRVAESVDHDEYPDW